MDVGGVCEPATDDSAVFNGVSIVVGTTAGVAESGLVSIMYLLSNKI